MSLFVALTLEPAADLAVRRIWNALAETGINRAMLDSNCPPHVTLGDGLPTDRDALVDQLADFAASATPFPLVLSSVGSFSTAGGVLFYGVTVTRPLLELHAAFDRLFAHHVRRPNAYYRVGTWVPHCTLAMGLSAEQHAAALAVARSLSLPLVSRIAELVVGEAEQARCRMLAAYALGGPETA
jgi:2'-5' RNA ligase